MKKRKIITAAVIVLLLAAAIITFFFLRDGEFTLSVPTVTVETPGKMSVDDRNEFSLDLRLNGQVEGMFPAASFSISFDPAKLEFLGIDEGNIVITNPDSSSGTSLPEWSVNTERSNKTGVINIMYLDITGGKYAFSGDLLDKKDNVVLRLSFRLRGSVRAGDILELCLDDAVFAANDEARSLSSTAKTLRTVNGRIVIGDSK